jgi:hypothetical protein
MQNAEHTSFKNDHDRALRRHPPPETRKSAATVVTKRRGRCNEATISLTPLYLSNNRDSRTQHRILYTTGKQEVIAFELLLRKYTP